MDKYRRLVNNSIIFAVGSFGSKFISFFMLPLYTYTLAQSDYGITDLVQTTVSLLLPVISLSVFDAVLRFIMDQDQQPEVILTCGFFLTVVSAIGVALIGFGIAQVSDWPYLRALVLILIIQSFQNLLAQYIKAINHVRLYAANGIILTLLTAGLNIWFLWGLRLGAAGFFQAMILANLTSVIYLAVIEKIHRQIKWRYFSWAKLKTMLRYSVPLMPNATAWWTTNMINRYFILYFLGQAANGLFAVANKIPMILSVVNSVFFQAWQLSAIETYGSEDSTAFYKNIFAVYSSCLLLGTSWLIVGLRPLIWLLVSDSYQSAWRTVPFLLLTVVYTSFASFYGQYYIAAKKTFGVFTTTIIAAGINVLGNFILVPRFGLNGAGFSAMISFFCLWLIRYFDTKKFVTNQMDLKNLIGNHGLILLQLFCLYHWSDQFWLSLIMSGCVGLFALYWNRQVLQLLYRFVKLKFRGTE
ncbi:lipopolysaccharide biosynthesis protein [Agrilactobacillus yilanensis]|uniref:Lipopolysaccharide biosynthesis protein n=1 Tax=Agrilactobacillus yilanensis TaxID=2485997 RepID=A0ABW4J9C3_9LACO|nr:polysaccharide biosynthesis C-terminal domain-containing protein [Agrilactobacillus yilanensis]